MIVVVLGMHRAGTSMLSSVLHAMGVVMGPPEHLARSNPESQPLGYWEDQGFVRINRGILADTGGHWHQPPERAAILKAGEQYRPDIAALIEQRDNHLRWGWKDPRSCLTIECYQPQLTGRDARYIQIVRDRQAIADSLIRRGETLAGTADRDGFADLAALHERRVKNFFIRYDPPRLAVTYEAMTDPDRAAGEVGRIAEFLGIDGAMIGQGLAKIKMKTYERTLRNG